MNPLCRDSRFLLFGLPWESSIGHFVRWKNFIGQAPQRLPCIVSVLSSHYHDQIHSIEQVIIGHSHAGIASLYNFGERKSLGAHGREEEETRGARVSFSVVRVCQVIYIFF
jgi:hypothetical protein